MSSVLITGANRGLGLEFAKQYSDDGWRVFACCRHPDRAKELNDLARASDGRLSLHPLDVSLEPSISALAEALQGDSIDILLNNAGIYGDENHDDFGKIDYERWVETFRVNVMGAMKVTETFVGNVASSEKKVLAFMSSLMGSISDNGSGGSYLYRSSKAALNAIGKSLSIDLKGRGVKTVCTPGGSRRRWAGRTPRCFRRRVSRACAGSWMGSRRRTRGDSCPTRGRSFPGRQPSYGNR
jgi:NAD(P)-dependent dehydrogenase (short-subunit alcohol dehydrogenase family)